MNLSERPNLTHIKDGYPESTVGTAVNSIIQESVRLMIDKESRPDYQQGIDERSCIEEGRYHGNTAHNVNGEGSSLNNNGACTEQNSETLSGPNIGAGLDNSDLLDLKRDGLGGYIPVLGTGPYAVMRALYAEKQVC